MDNWTANDFSGKRYTIYTELLKRFLEICKQIDEDSILSALMVRAWNGHFFFVILVFFMFLAQQTIISLWHERIHIDFIIL